MEERHFGPIWFIPGPNKGKYPHCHSVYIRGAGVLIDPAADRERTRQIRDEYRVDQVWLSHWHEDHFTHLDLLEDAPLRIHSLDEPPLKDLEVFQDWYGMDRVKDKAVRDMWEPMLLEQFHYKPRTPSHYFEDGQVLDLGVVSAQVIHAPGHTPGHTALFFPEVDVLFVADFDLTWFGPWYGDPGGSIEDTIRSVKALKRLGAKTVLTCHEDGVFENPADSLWDDYLAVIDAREEKLLAYLDRPRTMEEIVGQWITYKKERQPLDFYAWAERLTMAKHLEERLVPQGVVVKEGEHFVRKDA